MQPAGFLVMVLAVGTVTVLFAWCVWQVLTQPAAEMEHLHGTELQTPDIERP